MLYLSLVLMVSSFILFALIVVPKIAKALEEEFSKNPKFEQFYTSLWASILGGVIVLLYFNFCTPGLLD